MALLEDGAWRGKVWTGAWTDGSGGTYTAVEPATGGELGEVGKATPADVEKAAVRAVEAQHQWAALPFDQRAAVLRRAGDLLAANADEIKTWLARESGAIQPFGDFQVHTSAQECTRPRPCPATRTGRCCAAARRGCPSSGGCRSVWSG
jgi:benzaldehyde dehydrogenase (NAD)